MKTPFKTFFLCLSMMLFAVFAFAQDTVPAPAETIEGFFSQTLTFIKQFGGLPWVLKIAGISAILISTLKVSTIRELTWDKLGNAKVWAAPVLGLIFGVLSLGTNLTLASALAYILVGEDQSLHHQGLQRKRKLRRQHRQLGAPGFRSRQANSIKRAAVDGAHKGVFTWRRR